MKIVYDKQSDALYIYLSSKGHEERGVVKRTTGDWPIHIDYDKDDRPFGVEILDASSSVSLDYLKSLDFEVIDEK